MGREGPWEGAPAPLLKESAAETLACRVWAKSGNQSGKKWAGNSPTSSSRLEVELLWLAGSFFSGVFFYVPGKRHFPKLKMSFPINGGVWVLPAVEVAVMQGLCEDMSVCKAESAQQRVSQRRSGWPITSVSDEKVPPACLYRCAGTWCARHGDGWSPPLHHMAALARAAAPWRGSCGCKWVILC